MSLQSIINGSNSRCVDVNRLEWLDLLRRVKLPPEEPDIATIHADLVVGANAAGVDVVMIERWQAKRMWELVPNETAGG